MDIATGGEMTESWNYYFERCRAASNSGATVELPEGHGIVTIDDRNEFERVFFPSRQAQYDLVHGVVAQLERNGLAVRYGKLR
ncbi:MAG: hypothetical protein J4F33_12480 [Alphaproteobacteria bacterium]|nr:hypothetical protein [Alphaproteobacteria bacterium]